MPHFSSFPLRAFEDEGKAKLGVLECTNHGLLQPFNVLQEKEGERSKDGCNSGLRRP